MLSFIDGVMVASMFWLLVSCACILIGYVAASFDDPINWIDGYEAGRKAVMDEYMLEIYEREGGSLNI